jgi:universal stress protein A
LKRYKRILVATDFSDINRIAVERAALLAKQDASELILLHVIEHFPFDSPLASAIPASIKPDDILVKQARSQMSQLATALEVQNARKEISVTSRSARREILRFAEAHGVDLIVVAPHGRGIIGALGSTAMGILNGAVCDVLAVRSSDKLA